MDSNEAGQKKSSSKKYTVLGMMSGTSLDGIDLSLCTYEKVHGYWQFSFDRASTFPYTQQHIHLIKQLQNESLPYAQFHKKQLQYSQLIVSFITQFLSSNNIANKTIDYIALHGHTIFHNPTQKITVQAGNLAYIAGKLAIDVVGNFRELDVMRGGEGAPLVPYGEELFADGVYVNLGGIANIGFKGKGFDVVFCNMVLNAYSQKISGKKFDEGGQLGRKGKIDQQFLTYLQEGYSNKAHHSLAREQAQSLLQKIETSTLSESQLLNQLRTFYQFIKIKIIESVTEILAESPNENPDNLVRCTGGGAYNNFLIQSLNQNNKGIRFAVPDAHIVQFKEAIVFGLLAVKFVEGERNCGTGVGGMLVKGRG